MLDLPCAVKWTRNRKASPRSWATMVSWWSKVQTSSLQKCTSQWKKEDLHQQKLTFVTFFDHPRCSLMPSLIQKFLRNPVPCTDFIRLRVGRDGGSLNWFGLNYSCVFLSLCPSIPLSFLCGVRITQWYWAHLLYKREAMMDRLACAHTLTFIQKGLSC